jgi:hypothetical protein
VQGLIFSKANYWQKYKNRISQGVMAYEKNQENPRYEVLMIRVSSKNLLTMSTEQEGILNYLQNYAITLGGWSTTNTLQKLLFITDYARLPKDVRRTAADELGLVDEDDIDLSEKILQQSRNETDWERIEQIVRPYLFAGKTSIAWYPLIKCDDYNVPRLLDTEFRI